MAVVGVGLTNEEAEEAQLAPKLAASLIDARKKLADIKIEYDDLTLLYEATISHGEAVEDQLAESNILLKHTQARLEEELKEATRYAMSILPEPRKEWPNTLWHFEPSTELGGDSFGYHNIDPDHFAIYLIDVCGHGVGAALLSVAAINVLRAGVLPDTDFRKPGSVLAALNNAFPMEKQNDMFFTIWYGVHSRRNGELLFSSGGHPGSILLRAEPDKTVSTRLLGLQGNLMIGAFPDVHFSEDTVVIEPGDRLIVLSDGTFEIDESEGNMLTQQDLVEFASGDLNRGPAEIYAWVQSINGEGPLPDDFSLVEVSF